MIKAILFDSGRVLNGPVTGHWFITPRFFEYVDKEKFMSIDKDRIKNAFTCACNYINEIKTIKTTEEELKQFTKYYKIFSECLPELEIKEVEEIARDMTYNTSKYSFFEDAKVEVDKLSKKYKLAVVSDAWPSMENVYIDANMKKYFEIIVISSQLGVAKPDREMYETAIKALGINNNEAVFIDDKFENCIGAEKLGIRSIMLCRENFEENKEKYKNLIVLKDLVGLEEVIKTKFDF